MRFAVVIKTLGLLLMIFSFSMLPPIIISWWLHDGTLFSFVTGIVSTFMSGFVLWFLMRKAHFELKTKDGFLIVFLLWSVLSVFGALPFMLDSVTHLSLTDAVFEAVSGLTTTGSTVMVHLNKLPVSASNLYAKNVFNFIANLYDSKNLSLIHI